MNEILEFWFNEIESKSWYMKDPEFDALITDRFSNLFESCVKGELASWRETIHGRLAEIILLDQFSRNMFRDTAKSFQFDFLALALAQEACNHKDVEKLTTTEKSFLYMPFMHSESLLIHEHAVELFSQKGLENNLEFELKHKAIIEKFGRYPHRNSILSRESTPEEVRFLSGPNSSF